MSSEAKDNLHLFNIADASSVIPPSETRILIPIQEPQLQDACVVDSLRGQLQTIQASVKL